MNKNTRNAEAPGYYEGAFILSDGTQTIEVPTILFVQQPDYPLINTIALGLSGGNRRVVDNNSSRNGPATRLTLIHLGYDDQR